MHRSIAMVALGESPTRSRASGVALDAVFTQRFGTPPRATARAPGRVSLLGDHAEHVGGLALSLATPQQVRVALAPRRRRTVRAALASEGGAPVEFEIGSEALRGTWVDVVAGAVVALHGAGFDVGGFDVVFTSDVPIDAGLAPDAALVVALLRALRAALSIELDDVALAKISHVAEADFVGAPTTMADSMAASLADVATALLLDTRTLGWQRLALPESVELVVLDPGVRHERDGARAHDERCRVRRRAECERAAELLGVETLRDVTDPAMLAALPEPLARRARHVFTENARVTDAAVALRTGDDGRLGRVLGASHASLRDDFEACAPGVDRLVALAQEDEDVFGARVRCAGTGCTVVAVASRDRGAAAAQRIITRDANGAHVLVPYAGPPGSALGALGPEDAHDDVC